MESRATKPVFPKTILPLCSTRAQLKGHKAERHLHWGIHSSELCSFCLARTCLFLLIFTDKVLILAVLPQIFPLLYKNCTHFCTKSISFFFYISTSNHFWKQVIKMAFGLNQIGSLSAFFAFDMLHKFCFNQFS